MRATRLVLEDFRSYAALDLPLDDGVTVLIGPNGAGKTNVLEALALLAWGSSPRTSHDEHLVRWGAALARSGADVSRAETETHRLEVTLFAPPPGERRHPKRFRLDGAAKRLAEVAGELRVVAFFPEEVALLCEAPAARRRYLDAIIGQVDRRYRRDVVDLQRVTEQRNALLRRAREEGWVPGEDEMAFWNVELARLAGAVAARRASVVAELGPHFSRAHAAIAPGEGEIGAEYACQVPVGTAEEMAAAYGALLPERREHEVWQGATLVGPHRDDLRIAADGRPLPTFASRGEHRTAVLALKLAEASWLVEQTADLPVFLLDDVLSELDPDRRERLAGAVPDAAQALLTATAASAVPETLSRRAARLEVRPGEIDATAF